MVSTRASRRTLLKAAVAIILGSIAGLLILEVLLRVFLPIRSLAVGTTDTSTASNAAIYGWGFGPGDEIRQKDPDTGESFSAKANSVAGRMLNIPLRKGTALYAF
jgi:hypothetical protein